jgi:hypothetical protein
VATHARPHRLAGKDKIMEIIGKHR